MNTSLIIKTINIINWRKINKLFKRTTRPVRPGLVSSAFCWYCYYYF